MGRKKGGGLIHGAPGAPVDGRANIQEVGPGSAENHIIYVPGFVPPPQGRGRTPLWCGVGVGMFDASLDEISLSLSLRALFLTLIINKVIYFL